MKIVTAAQMRELDRKAIESGVPSLSLMERAGRGVGSFAENRTYESSADWLLSVSFLRRPREERPIGFLCGKGNNGGDGFVAARYLFELWRSLERQDYSSLRLHVAASRAEVRGDARVNLERLTQAGIPITYADTPISDAWLQDCDLIVDALLGTGISGEVTGYVGELIDMINRAGRPVVAVDVPSGLNADTGQPCGRAVRANWTVTMGLPKLGLFLHPGIDYAGRVEVVDIGLPPAMVDESPFEAIMMDRPLARALVPRRTRGAHKGDAGRVLVIAGSVGMTGAAALCSLAAMRTGSGLVTLAIPSSLNDIMEVKVTEVMTRPMPETADRSLSLAALPMLQEMAEAADAVALGPGLSQNPETQQLVRQLLPRLTKPTVIDADGLNALADDLSVLESRHAPLVLTPHPGELARLLRASTKEIQADRLGAARTAAERFGSAVILKGAGSVVAWPGEPLHINPTGNAGMASGGMGDVLTGVVASLLGQGLSPFDAARLGACVHGIAGDMAAEWEGEIGIIAGDMLSNLPKALREVSL